MAWEETPNIITLDLTGCKYLGEIHLRIRDAFDFPEWYGQNWSAFWDLLREPRENVLVEVHGINSLPKELTPAGVKILELLERNRIKFQEFMRKQSKFDRRFDYKVID